MLRNRLGYVLSTMIALALILSACTPAEVPTPVTVID
jgi:hypothetical protein